jgi:ribose transport system permease protein
MMVGNLSLTARGLLGPIWRRTVLFRPVLFLLIVLIVLFSITESTFFNANNFEVVLANSAVLWIVAMGMTFVLLSGGFDLSVGATAAISGIFIAKALDAGLPGGVVIVLAVLLGMTIGAVLNGLLVGKAGLSVFVVTLATTTALTGIVNIWSNSESFYVTSPAVKAIATEDLLGIPTPIWVMAGTFIVGLYVQTKTFFGRDVYAIGGSPAAARLAGIRVPAVLIAVYGLIGACAGLAGAVAVGRIGAAVPQVNNALALQAIAAVLLGGTALSGGSGGVGGTALGVLFIAVLNNGLSISGVSSDWQNVVTGVILVAAVSSDRIRLRRAPKSDPDGGGEAENSGDNLAEQAPIPS